MNASPEPENLRIPLLLRLTFADEIDLERPQQTLSEHRRVHEDRLDGYRALDRVLCWFKHLPDSMRPRD